MSERKRRGIEWPTVGLASVIYGAWFSLTWFHASLPGPLLLVAGAWTVAWHASLQHELIHGHPTRLPWLNRALGLPPLLLHLPFDRYRALHLLHHRDDRLTDPLDDPETHYLTPAAWRGLGRHGQLVMRATAVLAGRLLIGPAWAIGRYVWSDATCAWRGEPGVRAAWAWHAAMLALVLAWILLICRMSLATYATCFWLPGTALLLLRSFAEHRAAEDAAHRTAIVEHAPVLGLLFLHNNLHAAHHERPGLAWYRLPAWYRGERERLLAKNGRLVYRGYADVARRYLFQPHDRTVHPRFAAGPESARHERRQPERCLARRGPLEDAGLQPSYRT